MLQTIHVGIHVILISWVTTKSIKKLTTNIKNVLYNTVLKLLIVFCKTFIEFAFFRGILQQKRHLEILWVYIHENCWIEITLAYIRINYLCLPASQWVSSSRKFYLFFELNLCNLRSNKIYLKNNNMTLRKKMNIVNNTSAHKLNKF